MPRHGEATQPLLGVSRPPSPGGNAVASAPRRQAKKQRDEELLRHAHAERVRQSASSHPCTGIGVFELKLHDLFGNKFDITASQEWTVLQLKEQIRAHRGETIEYQDSLRLLYTGQSMEDDHILASYESLPGSTVMLSFQNEADGRARRLQRVAREQHAAHAARQAEEARVRQEAQQRLEQEREQKETRKKTLVRLAVLVVLAALGLAFVFLSTVRIICGVAVTSVLAVGLVMLVIHCTDWSKHRNGYVERSCCDIVCLKDWSDDWPNTMKCGCSGIALIATVWIVGSIIVFAKYVYIDCGEGEHQVVPSWGNGWSWGGCECLGRANSTDIYVGDRCQTEVNCDCHGHGTQTDIEAARAAKDCRAGKCTCEGNFVGGQCEANCDCNGHGTQANIAAAIAAGSCSEGRCECEGNFVGKFCEEACDCSGHGTQTDIVGARAAGSCSGGSCTCNDNFAGEYCALHCGEHGTGNGRVCVCNQGYSGDRCQYDPCHSMDCGSHAVCEVDPSTHLAYCKCGRDALPPCSDVFCHFSPPLVCCQSYHHDDCNCSPLDRTFHPSAKCVGAQTQKEQTTRLDCDCRYEAQQHSNSGR